MKKWAPLLAAALAATLTLAGATDALAARRAKGPKITFPMKPGAYRKLAEARLARVLAVIDKKLDRGNVSPERRTIIHKMFDDAAKEARAEAARATADGAVTEAEATKVKELAIQVRAGVRERMAAERKGKDWEHTSRGSAAKAKAKAKAPAKDTKAPAKATKAASKAESPENPAKATKEPPSDDDG